MQFFRQIILTGTAFSALATPAFAQIQIDQLTPASAYDAGVLDPASGGLDSTLWQGTDAARAVKLIASVDKPLSGPAHDLALSALLSGGVPPQAADSPDRDAYVNARLGAILSAGNIARFDQLISSGSLSENDPALRIIFTKRALLVGHTDKACGLTDNVTDDRALPYWAKIRAYCHFIRGEIPAAELTVDLLKRGDHNDGAFFDLIGTLTGSSTQKPDLDELTSPLHIAMARDMLVSAPKGTYKIADLPATLAAEIAQNGNFDGTDRLVALKSSAQLLTSDQVRNVLAGFGGTIIDTGIIPADVEDWSPSHWGQAFIDLKSNSDMAVRAQIAAQMLSRAEKAGILTPMAKALGQDISFIPATLQAGADPIVFAKLAVMNTDLGALGSLYQSLPGDDARRGRIALASDALGGGFTQAPLGIDIETRLGLSDSHQKRAIRDTFIAVALGANMSDKAADIVDGKRTQSGQSLPEGSLLALQSAARRNSKAEAALRAAAVIGDTPLAAIRDEDLAAILTAFREAGMYQTAGRLAAHEFLSST